MDKDDINRIYKQLEQSLIGYEVNGNPTKRKFTLRNIAWWLVKKRKTKQGKK